MSSDIGEFDEIRPYTDEEAAEALHRLAQHPNVVEISKFLIPEAPPTYLRDFLMNVKSIDEFQTTIMSQVIQDVLKKTAHNFSYDGLAHLDALGGNRFLAMSNHRDIIIDPAIMQWVLYCNGYPLTEVAVGDNLLSNEYVEYLIRSNRMIKVIRGISARSLYLSSKLLSRYIRQAVTTNKSSVWIAQREGRTKDGVDTTEQGLLKMLDMSGEGEFTDNFKELNIVPLSISYEYEPCDIRKAREVLISRYQKYEKGSREDLVSILTGIRQQKGNIHLNIGQTLSREEIEEAAQCTKNDRYQAIRHDIDSRIISGYKLWKTNYMACDMIRGESTYADSYTPEDVEAFTQYTEHQLDTVEKTLDRDELRDVFLHIYANPVISKEKLADGTFFDKA